MPITATRYHDFSCGHRVAGHESMCAHLHGHNYRVHFTVEGDALDPVGRVLDFSAIKARLCEWLEAHWDHRFLYWDADPVMIEIARAVAVSKSGSLIAAHKNDDEQAAIDEYAEWQKASRSFVAVPFNPTAENMGEYLLKVVGPHELAGTGVRLVRVVIEETRKCSAEVSL